MPYLEESVGNAASRCVLRDQFCGDNSGSCRFERVGGSPGTGRAMGPVNMTFSVLAAANGKIRASKRKADHIVADLSCVT